MALANNVTTMTLSDFGRTRRSNGQGSDHGCSGHHWVLGGAVNGGRLASAFPTVALNTATDVGEVPLCRNAGELACRISGRAGHDLSKSVALQYAEPEFDALVV